MKQLLLIIFLLVCSVGYSQSNWTYAGGNGSSGAEVSRAICTDAAGNIYVTGNFSNTVDLDYGSGTASATSAGSNDAFISSYTSTGAYRWSLIVGSAGPETAISIITNGTDVYATGSYSQTASIGGSTSLTSTGAGDIYLVKLNASTGAVSWAVSYGALSGDSPLGLCFDASNNVYMAGTYTNPWTGTCTTPTTQGSSDIFIQKINPANGSCVWASAGGSSSGDGAEAGICFIPSSNKIVVSTSYSGASATFGSFTLNNVNSSSVQRDIVILELNASTGAFSNAITFGTSTNDDVSSGVYDQSTGNVFVSGSYQSTLTLPNGGSGISLTSVGGNDIWLGSYSPTAHSFVWAKSAGGTSGTASDEKAYSITSDGTGTIAISGSHFSSPTNFGSLSLSNSSGFGQIFIAGYNALNGNELWVNNATTSSPALQSIGRGITTNNNSGTFWVTGTFCTTTTFGSQAGITSAGFADLFNAKFTAPTAPTVTTTTASGVGATSATIGGEVTGNGGSTVTERGIVWATTTNPTIDNTKVANGSGNGIFSGTVSSLPSSTLIYYRAYATNLGGTAYGSELSFTTTSAGSPEINIQGNSVSISDGDLTPSTLDHTSFGSQSVCSGTIIRTFTIQNTGTSNLTFSNPTISGSNASDFSVSSNPTSPVSASGSTTFQITFNPSAAGLRSATVSLANNDSDEATYDFAVEGSGSDVSLTALSQTNVSCNGGSNGAASINTPTGGAGGYTYNWTPGNPTGDGTVSVTGLTAGSWTCTVTDANSCTATQTFTITQPTGMTVTSSSQTNVSCNGGSNGAASINTPTGGAGGYTYNWTPGNPTGDGTVSVTGLTAGSWTCTVTDANSCTATQTFTITQPTGMTVTSSSQTN
ncbi:choice-of-anchor D domain-containing protein, partial [Lacihabitans sp. CS3-21]|uniref:choice-of-anchor D domain-containing protein n=1 Tax=Lacihabitans sp. CS3-21 TaxID=2487332 RepID=UPI0020CD864B